MKTVWISVCLIFAALSAYASPVITCDKDTLDFGTFKEDDGKVSGTLLLKNTGDENLVITGVRATCGCTDAKTDKTIVAPGATTTLHVTYDPSGRPGTFYKKVFVTANTNPTQTTFYVVGNVIANATTLNARFPYTLGSLRLKEVSLSFGPVYKYVGKTSFIQAYNGTLDTLRLKFTDMPPHISVSCVPAVIGPEEQATIAVSYNADRVNDWGRKDDTFVIRVNDEPITVMNTINVNANIQEYFGGVTDKDKQPKISVSPTTIDLGILKTNNIVTSLLKVTNNGDKELKIRKVSCNMPGITFKMKKDVVAKGKSENIKVEIDPKLIKDNIIDCRIIIINNDPTHSQYSLRMVGEKAHQ